MRNYMNDPNEMSMEDLINWMPGYEWIMPPEEENDYEEEEE